MNPEGDAEPASQVTPQSALLDNAYLFNTLLESTGDSVYVKDRQCRLVRVSRTMARNLGFARPEDLIGLTDHDLFPAEFANSTTLEDIRIMETDAPLNGLIESRQLPDGAFNWTLTSKLPLHDNSGRVIGLLGITREINELKQAEMNLQYLATHDSLTGLPNRYLMSDRLSQVVHHAQRESTRFAVLFVDIDNFKAVNDARGHAAGDELLRSLAERMRTSLRASDTIARIGGDEFVLIIEGADGRAAAEVSRKLLKAGSAGLHAGTGPLRVTLSVGIALYPDHGTDGATLVTAADHAMYLAKQSGKNRSFVYPSKGDRSRALAGRSA
jgi:diguanylate cyclase (GGDEF)-like protein/PAS domain S-box-containing protein